MKSFRSSTPNSLRNRGFDPCQPYLIEDLLQSEAEWRNIQDIVRVSFKCLSETMKSQGQSIREIERNMGNRVSFSDFHADLAQKIDFVDFSEKVASLKTQIDGKASIFDVQNAVGNRTQEFNWEKNGKFEQFADKSMGVELRNSINQLNGKLVDLQEEIMKIRATSLNKTENFGEIHKKVNKLERKSERNHKKLSEDLEMLKIDVKSQFSSVNLTKDFEKHLKRRDKENSFDQKSFYSNDLKSFLYTIEEKVSQKNSDSETHTKRLENEITALKNFEFEAKAHLKTFENRLKEWENTKSSHEKKFEILKTCIEDLNRLKPSKEEINEALNKLNSRIQLKADTSDLEKLLKFSSDSISQQLESSLLQKLSKTPEISFLDLKSKLQILSSEIASKASKSDLSGFISLTQNKFEDFSKDLLLKASIKDICILLDMKANIEDINVALSDVHKELDEKSPMSALLSHISEQENLNTNLCILSPSAKYIWKSGDLLNGNLIPWDLQSVNTMPDNFLWNRAESVLVVTPGLYQVSLGVYNIKQKKGILQVIVNGNVMVNGERSYIGSFTEILNISEKGKIAVLYTGDSCGCEGFLTVTKLL